MKALLKESVDGVHGVLAPEVKYAVLSFQEPPRYVSLCLCGRATTDNQCEYNFWDRGYRSSQGSSKTSG